MTHRPIKPYVPLASGERTIGDVLNELVEEVNELGSVLEVVASLVLMHNKDVLSREQRIGLLHVMEEMITKGKI